MGCRKLSYGCEADIPIFRDRIEAEGSEEKSPLKIYSCIEEINDSPIFCLDYSPFGLSIAALSSSRENTLTNKFLYQGMELQTDLGWDSYLADFRSYDPTIGRWGQVDPKANEFVSPYSGMGNNPIKFVDPLGDTIKIKGSAEFILQYFKDAAAIEQTEKGTELLKSLRESEQTVLITEATSLVGSIKDFFEEGSGDKDHLLSSQTKAFGVDPFAPEKDIDLKYSQINNVEFDEIESESSEVLLHELQHASDIMDGTIAKKQQELGRSHERIKELFDFAESRAMQSANELRFLRGTKIRTNYNGRQLLNSDGTRKKVR